MLSRRDKVMAGLVKHANGSMLMSHGDAFYTLMRSITGQQVSVAAADAIWARLEQALSGVTPENLIKTDEAALKACGLSRQKIAYSHGIAHAFLNHQLEEKLCFSANDQEVENQLITLKGVGRWTVEMFQIFHRLHPRMLPRGDVGIVKAVERHYGAKIDDVASLWEGYETIATWHLWRSLDPVPVQY